MSKKEIIKILSKIKDTVAENNYKLALAITEHRTGKIKDIIMCSKDGELLLKYIEQLEQQCKKQKEVIDKTVLELANIDGGLSYGQLSDRICNLIDILKEVS